MFRCHVIKFWDTCASRGFNKREQLFYRKLEWNSEYIGTETRSGFYGTESEDVRYLNMYFPVFFFSFFKINIHDRDKIEYIIFRMNLETTRLIKTEELIGGASRISRSAFHVIV